MFSFILFTIYYYITKPIQNANQDCNKICIAQEGQKHKTFNGKSALDESMYNENVDVV